MITDDKGNKRFFGVYRGTVADVKDPNKQRRVKLTIPQVMGTAVSEWAWPQDSSAVQITTPSVGQGVWVSFEGGDPSYPIWSATFGKYSGKGTPVQIFDLPKGSYPPSIKTAGSPTYFDLVNTIIDLAARVDVLEEQMPIALQNGI